jgi:transcriptional regulator with XRE-family HTH domain
MYRGCGTILVNFALLSPTPMLNQKDFYEEVGRRIRRARHDSNVTQEGLGTTVRLTRTSITNIERGRQKLPLHTLAEIADALGVEIAKLLPERVDESRPTLDRVLQNRSEPEREFIRSAVNAVRPGSTKR